MGIDVNWGRDRTPLHFDRYPYPGGHPYGYEPEVISVIERFLVPGDVAIDGGASIGFHTCLMSKLVGPEGLVFAFEPNLESFRYLMHHVHTANQLNNVSCLRVALWKEDAPELWLHSARALGYSSMHKYLESELAYSEKVEGVALDGLLSENEHPRLIKIDCEGTEAEVLLGAHEILEKGVDCVVLELNYCLMDQTGRSDFEIRRYMKDLGYDMFLISLSGNNTNGYFRNPMVVPLDISIKLEGGHHINVMFSTEEKVRQRWSKIDNISDL